MGIIYWKEDGGAFHVATSMQAISVDANLWNAYIGFGSKGRDVFKQCAVEDHEWFVDTVIAYASFVEKPSSTASAAPSSPPPAPPAAAAPAARVRVPQRGEKESSSDREFIAWMTAVSNAVRSDAGLSFEYGDKRVLRDGTVAVSVSVSRGGSFLRRVSFVFHYHPGSQGAGVGAAYGSKWHFKPYDGAPKWIRLPDYKFGDLHSAMVRKVKDIARGK